DAVSGLPDAEVYEYDAQTGRLACASCNPSGARPRGVEFGQLLEGESLLRNELGSWPGSGWVAPLLPRSPSFTTAASAYQPPSLTNSGRLFFNAIDSLAPQDQNQQWDVYEYEPAGVGGCAASAPGYLVASQSCLGLLSSGASGKQSVFLDSSESGADAFFITS